VVAGYRRIGVLKSIGFTPGQVAASYIAQIGGLPSPGWRWEPWQAICGSHRC
jgi:hypothetical protein